MIWFLPAIMALVFWFRGGHGLARWTGSQVWKAVYGTLLAAPVLILGGGVLIFLAAVLLAFGAVTLGHGSGLDMGRKSEFAGNDGIITWFARKLLRLDPATERHDMAVMFVSGFLYGLPLFLVSPWALAVCFGLGLAKMAAYAGAWGAFERFALERLRIRPIPLAEFATGALQGGVLAAFVSAAQLGL